MSDINEQRIVMLECQLNSLINRHESIADATKYNTQALGNHNEIQKSSIRMIKSTYISINWILVSICFLFAFVVYKTWGL